MIQVCGRKPCAQVDVQTPDQTALHPLTPSQEKKNKKRRNVKGEESALEVLKLFFFHFEKERNTERREEF